MWWWFEPSSGKLGYGDNRVPKTGRTHKVKGELRLCCNGLHASPTPWGALQYASGTRLWQVILGGDLRFSFGKAAGTERKYLKVRDIKGELRAFARRVALEVAYLWNCPPDMKQCLEIGDDERYNEETSMVAWDAIIEAAACRGTNKARVAGTAAAAAAWATDPGDAWDMVGFVVNNAAVAMSEACDTRKAGTELFEKNRWRYVDQFNQMIKEKFN